MKRHPPTARLAVLLVVSVLALVCARTVLVTARPRSDTPAMRAAELCAARWFRLIESKKLEAGVRSEVPSSFPHAGMLGVEWSDMTTTLGSLEAKRTAANPVFAALLVRLLHDAGVDSASCVGVLISGSFPSLAVATLAALQTIGAEVVLISSLGASSYGANQPGASWLDMEEWLRAEGGLRYRSVMVTMGAEGDSGGGLPDEGLQILSATAARYGRTLANGRPLEEAIGTKLDILLRSRIAFLVNIGGSQTSLGTCPHAPILPSGYPTSVPRCTHPGRGLIERCAEKGIRFLHLLNINAMAARYGMPLSPAVQQESDAPRIYADETIQRGPLLAGMMIILLLLFSSASIARVPQASPPVSVDFRPLH